MLSLYLALIGLLVGLALDAIIVRLAVPPDDDDASDDATEPEGTREATAGPIIEPPSLHAEAGTLVLALETSRSDWARRLLVVGATAGLFAVAGARYSEVSHLAVVTAWVSVLLICAGTDLLAYRVPNVVTYPAIIGAIVVGATLPGANIYEVLAGGLLAGGVLFLPALFTGGRGMGMGDVKLATFVGLSLGFTNVVPAMLVLALGGGLVAAVLLIGGLRKRGEPIPYAPFISAGGLAALLWAGGSFERLI